MGLFSKRTAWRKSFGLERRKEPDAENLKPAQPVKPSARDSGLDYTNAPPQLKVAVAPPTLAAAPCRFIVTPRKLGSGAYGSVLMGSDAAASPVAIKIIADGRMKPAALAREVALLERLSDESSNPSLMRFYGHYPPAAIQAGAVRTESAELLPLPVSLSGCHCLVMEMAKGGELFERVVKAGGYSEHRSAPLFAQLCSAVRSAHELGIVHRDLKLENVLYVHADGEGGGQGEAIKLIDWGLAHQHAIGPDGRPVPERLHSRCGSRSYMAPEVADRQHSSTHGYDGFKADVWSLGVCLFAMHLGFFPFEQAEPDVDWRARRVRDAQREGASTVRTIFTFYPRKVLSLSPTLIRLIDSMLIFDPSRRCTLADVLGSTWLSPHVVCDGASHDLASPMEVDVDGPPLPTHRRTSSGGSANGYSTGANSSSSPRSSYSYSSHTPGRGEGSQMEALLERQDSTSTAYSVSSVGSSVVHSMSRLRHMASPSGRYEARLGSHYERHRAFVEETHYERAFHEAYGAPAASGALEFDLETRYAVAGSRPRSGSGGSDGKRSGGGSRSGGSRSGGSRSGGRRKEGEHSRANGVMLTDAEHAAACEAAVARAAQRARPVDCD